MPERKRPDLRAARGPGGEEGLWGGVGIGGCTNPGTGSAGPVNEEPFGWLEGAAS